MSITGMPSPPYRSNQWIAASSLVRAGHPQDILAHKGEYKVVADRGCHEEAGLAELALDIELRGEAVATMRIHGRIRRLPGRLTGEQLRHIRLRPATLARVKEPGGLQAQEVRGLDARVRLRDGKLNSLVGANRVPEDYPIRGVLHRSLNEPATIAKRFEATRMRSAFQLSIMCLNPSPS